MVSFWFFNSRDGSVCRKTNKLIFYFLIGLIGCNFSGKQNVSLWSHVSWRHSALGHYSWGKASFFLGCRVQFGSRKDSTSVVKSITEECQVLGQDAHILGVFKCGLYTKSVTLYLWQPVCRAAVGSPGRKAASGDRFGTGVLVISVCQTLLYCI